MPIPVSLQPLMPAAGSEAAVEVVLRHLRPAGLYPAGGRFGRGPDAQPHHLVNFLVACTAPQPGDGPSLVEAIKRSLYMTSPGAGADQGPRLGPSTLHDVLVRWIEDGARLQAEQPAESREWPETVRYDPERSFPDHLNFYFSPFKVELVWIGRNGHPGRTDIYAPPPSDQEASSTLAQRWQRSAIIRMATMPSFLINKAASVWLATLRRQDANPQSKTTVRGSTL
jgi:hypothetical protein